MKVKTKYVNIVEKYLDSNPQTSLKSYFPGLSQKVTAISQPTLQTDTEEMKQLASLTRDLETQRESLEDQLERMVKKAVANIHEINALSSQASNYLDGLISEVGAIYGDYNMQQIIQKNSI